MTLTKLWPASMRTRLNILTILIPVDATEYVAITTFPSISCTDLYSAFLSSELIAPETNTESGIICSSNFPVSILSTNTKVLPDLDIISIDSAMNVNLGLFVVSHFN